VGFNLDGTETTPEATSTPIPSAPPVAGLGPAPEAPRFNLDGSAPGVITDAQKINLSMDQPDQTPERAVRVLKMEKATKLPLPIIDQNLEDVEREVQKKTFDADRFSRENPKVAAWLAANPQHAALARDDTEKLSLLEKLIGSISYDTKHYSGETRRGTFYLTPVEETSGGPIHALRKSEMLFDLKTQRRVVEQRMQAGEAALSGKRQLPSERRMMMTPDVGRERLAELDMEIDRVSKLPEFGGKYSASQAAGAIIDQPVKLIPFGQAAS